MFATAVGNKIYRG